ncbi:MAG: ankyrin repeat domain-containing protein, partial [Proteobacteria bacterium]|nr:ankyrin repeat domain-containing protein [Pseudomonadota bacterium]
LLKNGAKVNPQNIGGETALHNSSIGGHYEIAKLLIENNANVNILTKNLKSPIHFSMLEGDHKEIAILLLENGAELDFEKTFLTDSPRGSSARDVFATARLYKLAGETYYRKGMHQKAIESYKLSAPAFNSASEKFLALSKNQKSKEERAKLINILSGIGYIGAAGTGTSSTWSFEDTDKYKTHSEASKALSTLCEEYSVQCTSIVKCYNKYGSGDELASCVSESQTEISKSEADKEKR